MATNYQTDAPRLEGQNRGRGVPAFVRCNRGLLVPEKVAVKADAMLVEDYYPEQSPLAEALGCGDDGMAIFDSANKKEVRARDQMILFENSEDPQERLMEAFGTIFLKTHEHVRHQPKKKPAGAEVEDEDIDVGMIVPMIQPSGLDIGSMMEDMMSAESETDLMEILEKFKDIPAAEKYAEACSKAIAELSENNELSDAI